MQFLPAAALALFVAAPAMAAPTVIDFESAPSYASVADTYAGQGVSFGGDALALQNDELGTYFSNAPSGQGVMFTVGSDATMNVANGFGNISFWFSSTIASIGGINIWSGLNGTGSLLASLDLFANAQDCADGSWCQFDKLSASFSELAYSMSFSEPYFVAYDNITLNAASEVPEPASLLLVSLGLAGLLAGTRRRNT